MSGTHLARIRVLAATTSLSVLMALTPGGVAADALPPGETPVETPQRHREAEQLGLSLLNCTRTGGWVLADGTCRVRDPMLATTPPEPLRLRPRISRQVAFAWASELAVAQVCDHVLPGRPELRTRFSAAGFAGPIFGENVGCSWGSASPADMVLRTHRSMQAEKRTRGWHWRNMKNRAFRSVGIGVASFDGRTIIVYDFYGR
jgi:hypothetical protein